MFKKKNKPPLTYLTGVISSLQVEDSTPGTNQKVKDATNH